MLRISIIFIFIPLTWGGVPYPDNKFRYVLQRNLFDPLQSTLNSSVLPSHYNVELVVNDGNSLVEEPHYSPDHPLPVASTMRVIPFGKVRIYGENQVNNSCTVILHFKELEINHSSVTVIARSKSIPVKSISVDEELHWFIIKLDEVLNAGEQVQIYMEFQSTLYNFADWGPRYSQYQIGDGRVKRYVTPNGGGYRKTMHDFYTRAIFPLFDEPHLQATFQLTVVHREGYRAISNTHLSLSNIPE